MGLAGLAHARYTRVAYMKRWHAYLFAFVVCLAIRLFALLLHDTEMVAGLALFIGVYHMARMTDWSKRD